MDKEPIIIDYRRPDSAELSHIVITFEMDDKRFKVLHYHDHYNISDPAGCQYQQPLPPAPPHHPLCLLAV